MPIEVPLLWHCACVGVLLGVWAGLTWKAVLVGWYAPSLAQFCAVVALALMTVSAGVLLLDSLWLLQFGHKTFYEERGNAFMHAALALWNGLILVGAIRGTSYAATALPRPNGGER